MNTYKITFTRENGTEGYDHFTALNERQARKDFAEVYRHGNGTITGVELVRENANATKQQERDALKKIRAILEPLGPQSYLRTAFEGCLEDAENNIDDDAAYSMKSRWEYAEEQVKTLKAQVAELQDKLAESEKDYEAAHAAAHEIAEQKDAEIARLTARRDELLADAKNGDAYIAEQGEQLREMQRRAEAAEAQVIALKAKLYDYMVAERGGAQA